MGLYDAMRVSLMMNPSLWNEPHLTELREIAEQTSAREIDPALRAPLEQLAAVLRLPLPDRTFRLVRREFDLQDPLIKAGSEYDVTTGIGNSPDDATFDLLVAHFLEPMDQAARAAGRWAPLAGCYWRLTYDAQRRNRPALVDLCAKRMVDILKEHQSYGDPNQSTSGIVHAQVAQRLIELDRHPDLNDLINSSTGIHRFHFVMFRIGHHIQRDQIDQARIVIRSELSPIAADIPDRLLQSMDGQVVPLSAQPKQSLIEGSRGLAREADPQELSLRGMLYGMAFHYVRRGNLDLATKQLVALQQDQFTIFHGRDELSRATWWSIAKEARDAGQAEVSRAAFQRMQEMYEREDARKIPETLPIELALVREAISLNAWDLVHKMHGGNSIEGPLVLGRAWFDRGNISRARTLIELSKGNCDRYQVISELPKIIVEFDRIGDHDRAIAILQEAEKYINADIFGIGFASEVLSAAARLNRFDLIEQSYSQSTDPGRRLLISIAASQRRN